MIPFELKIFNIIYECGRWVTPVLAFAWFPGSAANPGHRAPENAKRRQDFSCRQCVWGYHSGKP